jgi:hypothetical protein
MEERLKLNHDSTAKEVDAIWYTLWAALATSTHGRT